MARKKRSFQQPLPQTTEDQKNKPRYQDHFQQNVGRKIEDAGKKFQGQGKNILYGLAAIAVLAIIIGIFYSWNRRTNAAGQTALGKAIETSQAKVTDSPAPAGSTEKTFKTEKERAEAAVAEFQAVADKFGGSIGEKARYFAAVNRMSLDRNTAIQDLEGLGNSGGDVGTLAKFALAHAKADDGKTDEAIEIYKGLAGASDTVISKDTINLALAALYEKKGMKQEAVDLYFGIAKTASEAKDKDGKALPVGAAGREAKTKLEQLDPEKAKEIKEPEMDPSALGGMPFGN